MEYRSIDGTGNNLAHSEYNQINTPFTRLAGPTYADDQRGLIDGPNPRVISNNVVGQGDATALNPQGLSAMMYAWGQFIDHDINLTADARTGQPIGIVVPDGDAYFTPGSTIPMTRADADAAGNPLNAVTGWIDASMVYGSTEATAARLRTTDGYMLVSNGNNLPVGSVDPTGENTSNEGGLVGHIAGDGRADENPSLTALQTLFVREHNFQVDRLRAADPAATGDQLYDQAKAIVTAEIEHITYSEFLPHLLGDKMLPTYNGYDPTIDSRMAVEFAGAAYRFGHSIVSAVTEKLDEQGNTTSEINLREVFFQTPDAFAANGGADALLRHLGDDSSQAMDVRIVEDLRNFLFDPPVGLDLAAINIQRGRDLGLPRLNDMREALHLDRYTDFAQITNDQGTVAALRATYSSVDQVDLWTGGLAETTMPNAFVGQTFQLIISDQFERSRDGDRLWYQNQGFDPVLLAEIDRTTLSDIVLRNTSITHLQDDLFITYERRAPNEAAEHPNGPQLVVGSSTDETLLGGASNDILAGGGGNDRIDGGAGVNTAMFDHKLTHFVTMNFGPTLLVIADGATSQLANITILKFQDGSVQNHQEDPLFDSLFYNRFNPDVFMAQADARAHYAQYGAGEGRDPDSMFSTFGYLSANADVRAAGLNPLEHFRSYGAKEQRDPSASFDIEGYLALNPDVASAGVNALVHYLYYGQAENRAILPAVGSINQINAIDFDREYYLLRYTDVGFTNVDPFQHFLQFGIAEGRNPNAFFDTTYYLSKNPDVAAAGMDPLEHFSHFGWSEGRDPSAIFSTSGYLSENPDVAAAHIDPLYHFLTFGSHEGRHLVTTDHPL